MSPNINSFVGDLVAMAQAMEELPKAQALIEDLRKQLDDAQRHNQGLEQNILGYKDTIAHWQDQAKVLSDQRDNAELRAMELEDKNNAVSRFLGSLMGEANSLRNVIDPPKPIEVAQPPVEDHTSSSGDTPADVPQAVGSQSATDPTAAETHSFTSTNAPVSVETRESVDFTNSASNSSEVSANPEPSWAGEAKTTPASPPQPYTNLMYENYPSWVSRQDWIAGGGTDYTYDYRKSYGEHLPF